MACIHNSSIGCFKHLYLAGIVVSELMHTKMIEEAARAGIIEILDVMYSHQTRYLLGYTAAPMWPCIL